MEPMFGMAMARKRNFKSNLVIGTVTLAVITAALTGLFGMRKIRSAQQLSPLRVVFEGGSVSGLRAGGPVNFNGVPVGRIISINLDSPRRVITLVTLNKGAPIRKDTAAGIEFQGLTGIATISLIGGAPSAPPVPPDQDGIPVLTADLSDAESAVEIVQNVGRMIASNEAAIKEGLRTFETYTADLKSDGAEIGAIMDKTGAALAGFDRAVVKIENVAPGIADGKANEVFEKLKSLRELSDTLKKKSVGFAATSHHTLLDVDNSANSMSRKFDPQGTAPVLRPPSIIRK